MKARFKEYVKWGDLTFEDGGVYDLDEMFLARLRRTYKIELVKEKVEQPEAPEAFKPVATFIGPLPDGHDDLAIAKPFKKPIKKKKK